MPGEKPIITVTHNSLDYTEYTVDIPGMWRNQEEAPNGIFFDVIELPEYGHTLEVGLPRIPVMRDLFAVPYDCSDIIIQVSDIQSVILDNYYIYPQQPPYPYLQEPPPFEWNAEFYNSDVWYPLNEMATGDMPGILRELEVRDMNMNAMKFNPYQRQLEVKYHFKVTMTYIDPGGWIPMPSPSGDFYQMYQYLIANIEGISGFGEFGKEGASGQYIYMIIHDSRFDSDPDFRNVLYEYAKYLTDRGFIVDVNSTTNIGGNDAYYIWNFLKKYYYSNRNLEYVLLVGDIPESGGDPYGIDMPAWTIYKGSNGVRSFSDMGYARLTPLKEMDPLKTDPFPDITVGRMVVNDANEFRNIVYKTTQYYYTDNGDYPWEKHCLIATGKKKLQSEPDDIYSRTKERIWKRDKEDHIYYKPPDLWEKVYGKNYNGTNEHVRDYLNNDGCSILNFYAHGGVDCWENWTYNYEDWDRSWILQLNNRALPVVFQCCCLVGSLDNPGYPAPDSLCEEWLNSPVGAVACCGSTSQLQCWDMIKFDPEPTSMVDDFWFMCIYGIRNKLQPIRSFGTVVYAGISKWISTYLYTFSQSSSYVLSSNQLGYVDSINVYGDPSLLMRSGVDHQDSLDLTAKRKENMNLIPLSIESIYPCPADDYINCVLSVPDNNIVNINIYDISGRVVSKSTVNIEKSGPIETNIETSGLSDGVYILKVTTETGVATKRFVIVR